MIDEVWEKAVAEGRAAHAEGKTDEDCPYPRGRTMAAWLTGRMEALVETPEAKTNEKKSLAKAKKLRKDK